MRVSHAYIPFYIYLLDIPPRSPAGLPVAAAALRSRAAAAQHRRAWVEGRLAQLRPGRRRGLCWDDLGRARRWAGRRAAPANPPHRFVRSRLHMHAVVIFFFFIHISLL
jgi:hypothetical protein